MNPIYSLSVALPSLYIVYLFSKKEGVRHYRKYENLDGLRGFAALGVFLSHSALYYFYLEAGSWVFRGANYSNSFYNNCGSGAVVMFFMMSAFLFYGKIREDAEMDWVRLYVSRVLRLSPMYLISSIIGLIIIFTVFRVNYDISLYDIKRIVEFEGVPNMFGIDFAALVTNGTAWTLPYEWTLYLSLPVIWVVVHRKTSLPIIFVTILSFILTCEFARMAAHYYELDVYFITGIIAYELSVSKISVLCRQFAMSKSASFIVLIVSMIVIYLTYTKSTGPLGANSAITSKYSIALYSLIFIIIALGNDMFGILSSSMARKLGEISYSFYILQFIVLGVFFKIAFSGGTLSIPEHFIICSVACATLVVISHYTFVYIENNAMSRVAKTSDTLGNIGMYVRRKAFFWIDF